MNWYNYVINAARQSKFNASHWFRYLRKVIFEDYSYLTAKDVTKLLMSDELTNFQKVSLKYAMQKGSPTHEHVVSLNQSAKLTNIRQLMEKYNHSNGDNL